MKFSISYTTENFCICLEFQVAKDLNLKTACPGSKFKAIFETVRELGGYLDNPDD
jgi:hypothetical protein